MNFTVIVPYAFTDTARERSVRFVTEWWAAQGYPVLIGEGGPPWSKGAAVDSRRRDVTTDGMIIADSDCVLSHEDLMASLHAVRDGAAWSMPHGRVYRLSRPETQRAYRLGVEFLTMSRQRAAARPAPPGGGLVVLSTAAYDTVGGIDPRFVGWGGEDLSFARALDTLAGEGVRFPGALWHLWHPRTPRQPGNRANTESEALAARYLDAEGHPGEMQRLVSR